MSYSKTYIGKGKKIANLDIIRVSISKKNLLEAMENDMVEYEGNQFLIFEVARLQNADDYNRTHTVYISKKTEEKPKRNAAPKKKDVPSSKKEPAHI